jgi:GT2 family glycosyltransferase
MTELSARAANAEPTISVIVVNLNGEEFLPSCLASILTRIPVPEIIVVDNGSTDGSLELIGTHFPDVKVIRNEDNQGFARPANQGAALASGDLLLFLNNDARLGPGTLTRLVAALEADSKVAACTPTTRRSEGSLDSAGSMFTRTGFLHHLSEDDLSSGRFGAHRFSLKGACFLIRSNLFHRAGRFDESYFAYFEETDLCWRLLSLGYKLENVSDALAIHDVGRTTAAIFPSPYIDYLSFRNRISTIRKNGDTQFKIRVLPVHIACCTVVATAFIFTGKFQNALGIWRALVWHLRPSSRPSRPINASERPTSDVLASTTVPFNWAASFRMLKDYLVRW